ncbi:DUF2157 domain-containing protein [Paenibacillus tarimensis]
MSRKWLEREAPRWVDQGIINADQSQRLLALYDEKKHGAGILPILGSILVGLGVLTFIAANWQAIQTGWLMLILFGLMAGFYAGGEWFCRRGDDKLGLALAGIGLAAFGASLFLIVQKFHLVDFQTTSFLLWGAAGVLLTWLYRSKFLFVLAAVILNVAGCYHTISSNDFSASVPVLLLLGLGAYWWLNRDVWLAWVLGASLLLQSMMLIGAQQWNGVWLYIPALGLYALCDWLRDRQTAYPLQGSGLTAIYLFGAFNVMLSNELVEFRFTAGEYSEATAFALATACLFILSVAGKYRSGKLKTVFEWILLLPWFFVPEGDDLLYLLALCFFSLYVLWQGYAEQCRFKVNLGTVLFLFAILLAYTRLAWAFMDKSLFFLSGGCILLLLSWYLNRRRRKFLVENGGNPHA